MSRTKKLPHKLLKQEKLPLDPFAGSLLADMLCKILEKHPHPFSGENDVRFLERSMRSLVKKYTFHRLRQERALIVYEEPM